ncbi:hypothetical protein Efla_001283 [Eimeria flavescens]
MPQVVRASSKCWRGRRRCCLLLAAASSLAAWLPLVRAGDTLRKWPVASLSTVSDGHFQGETQTGREEDFYSDASLPYEVSAFSPHPSQQQQEEEEEQRQQRRRKKQRQVREEEEDESEEEEQQAVEGEQQKTPLAGARQKSPHLQGQEFFALGLVMLIFCLTAIRSDPAGTELSLMQGVKLNAASLLAMNDVIRSLFVVLTAATAPFFLISGGLRLARTLPSYVCLPFPPLLTVHAAAPFCS